MCPGLPRRHVPGRGEGGPYATSALAHPLDSAGPLPLDLMPRAYARSRRTEATMGRMQDAHEHDDGRGTPGGSQLNGRTRSARRVRR